MWSQYDNDAAVAVIRLSNDAPGTFTYAMPIDSTPLEKAGQEIFAVGYARMDAQLAGEPDRVFRRAEVTINTKLETRPGRVTQVLPGGFGRLRWPGFLTDCPFDSGMSGGPIVEVINGAPTARGIICSDMSVSSDANSLGSGVAAFATMLWPCMSIQTGWPTRHRHSGVLVEKARLLDFVATGAVTDAGNANQHVSIFEQNGDVSVSWSESKGPGSKFST